MNKDAILCYIEGDWAFFTTQSLHDQWGDDWNDAPYESNAGIPYSPCGHREKGECDCEICEREWDGDKPKWEIVRISFITHLEAPADNYFNSPYSVQDINNKKVPWLKTPPWVKDGKMKAEIYAGTTLKEFIETIIETGGEVYLPYTENDNAHQQEVE